MGATVNLSEAPGSRRRPWRARFGGTLPELADAGDGPRVYVTVEGSLARAFDRGTSMHFAAEVGERVVQLFDQSVGA